MRGVTLALASAALIGAATRPWGSGFVAWIALIPLLVALRAARRTWRGALLGWLTSWGIGLAAFEGAAPAVPWAYPVLVLLAGGWWGAAGALFVATRRRLGDVAALVTFPAVVVAFEFVASRREPFGDLANGLGILGYTQADTPLRAAAGWSGMGGVSLAVVALNVALMLAWRRRHPRAATVLATLAVALLAIPVPGQYVPDPSNRTMRIGVVQGAVPNMDMMMARFDRSAAARALSDHAALTEEAVARGSDLVVWGETILPKAVRDGAMPTVVTDALRSAPAALVGGREYADTTWSNAALLWRDGTLTTAYRKRALVPLLEAGYASGRVQAPVDLDGMTLGLGICLDSVFGVFARESVRDGAEALIYITDDTFAGRTVTPELHLRVTAFRAAEVGRPVVFANESGPSAVFDARGATIARLEHGETATLVAPVAAHVGTTPFVRLGDWIGLVACLVTALLLPTVVGAALVARRSGGASRRVIAPR